MARGADAWMKNDLGNTPLLCAVENGHFEVAEYLSNVSPWHTANKAMKSFLSIVEKAAPQGKQNTVARGRILGHAKVTSDITLNRCVFLALHFLLC